MLWLFWFMRLSQRGHGESETEGDGDGQHEINQDLQKRNEFNQPYAARTGEKHVRQKPVADNNDQDDSDDGLDDFRPEPVSVAKYEMANDEGDGCRGQLCEERKSKGRALAGAKQPGLNQFFKSFNIFLKLTAQEFTALSVKPLHIRDEHEKATQEQHDRV